MLSKKILPLFIVTLTLVATSYGIITPPVPEWRGNEGTTYQQWLFSTDTKMPAPDTVDNPYGLPGLLVDPHPDSTWINDEMPGAVGVWPLSGEIDTFIPNRPGGEYKEIWITLRWKGIDDQGGELPFNSFLPSEPLVAVAPYEYMDMYKEFDQIDDNLWHSTVYVATIWPNPTMEWVSIKGNILVDELSIETICVPEPATIAILAIGGILTIRRRKNKG